MLVEYEMLDLKMKRRNGDEDSQMDILSLHGPPEISQVDRDVSRINCYGDFSLQGR